MDTTDLSNVKRPCSKWTSADFTTPTLIPPNNTNNIQRVDSRLLFTNNEYLMPCSLKNNSTIQLKTLVNYRQLTKRQISFAKKSPLHCWRVMHSDNSGRRNLTKIPNVTLNTSQKLTISPATTNTITTSTIVQNCISSKDKNIENQKFIIQSKRYLRHKENQKRKPIANNSNKTCYLKCEQPEMSAKVDSSTIPSPELPMINLFSNHDDDNNSNNDDNTYQFTFKQPLIIEQYTSKIAEKMYKNQRKMTSTTKPETTEKVKEIRTWMCHACSKINQIECTSCISCGTIKICAFTSI